MTTTDYAKRQRQLSAQKRNLTMAVQSGSSTMIITAAEKAIGQWEANGSWPDSWSTWDRALSDAYTNDLLAYITGRIEDKPNALDYDMDTITRRVKGLS